MWKAPLNIRENEIPEDFTFTTNRDLLYCVDAVVFHLPNLHWVMDDEIEKRDGQIWVAWSLESEENYPCIKNQDIREYFDLWMGYHQDDDILYPYYSFIPRTHFETLPEVRERYNKACMFISSAVNGSGRCEYLQELMNYTEIDSYGMFLHNKDLLKDEGERTLMDIIAGYKFVIGFENVKSRDYVTEKFYNPLLAGTVPVYRGAPNILEFIPGDECFVDVSTFETPIELAKFMNCCYEESNLYNRFGAWRKRPLLKNFIHKMEQVEENPFVRLCKKIRELKKLNKYE